MSDDYSKDKLMDDMNETDPDWSKKNIKDRQEAHGATPSEDDWSKDKMVDDGTGISPTTTTSSTTTTTTTNTASTSSTSTSSSTTTTATLPFVLVFSDGPQGTPLDPLALLWTPVPGPGHATMIDDGTLDAPSEADFITAIGAPLTNQLVLGVASTPGVYSAALVTLRMQSAAPGGDVVDMVLYDSTGAGMSAPGPPGTHVAANVGPGVENIQVLIPLVGPLPDVAISGGVIEFNYLPGPAGPVTIFDVRIELL